MKIDLLEQIGRDAKHDAELFYHAEVFDDAGQRYAVRLFTEGFLAESMRHKLGTQTLAPIADLVYRQVIAELVTTGRLRPGYGHLNFVYLVQEGRDAQDGDVLVIDAEERYLAAGGKAA